MGLQTEDAVLNVSVNGAPAAASINEMTDQIKYLTTAIDAMHKADNPGLYQSRVQQIAALTAARDAERASIKQTTDAIKAQQDGWASSFNTIKAGIGGLGIGVGISMLAAFGKELFDIQIKASGIENAFAKIGNTAGMLDKLRAAANGLISDLDLEKIAVKANNANIPLDKMATLLEFASQRARDTGEDVTALTEKLITGLGKGGTRSVAGLGISVKEVKDEFKKTGDMVEAVTNVIKRQMASAGKDVDTFGDVVLKQGTKWDNLKNKASKFFATMFTPELADASNIEKLTNKEVKAFGAIDKFTDSELDKAIQKQNLRQQLYAKEYAKAQKTLSDAKAAQQAKAGDQAQYADFSDEEAAARKSAEAYQSVRNASIALNKEKEKRTQKNEEEGSKGTVDFIDKQIVELQKEQKEVAKTSEEWKKYDEQIKKLQTERDDITGGKKDKKPEEFRKKLAQYFAEADKLTATASKGTEDELDAQIAVIKNKYLDLVRALQELLKSPSANKDVKASINAKIKTLGQSEASEIDHTKAAAQKAAEDKAKKDKAAELKETTDRVNNVYGSAKSDLDNLENNSLNGVSAKDPKSEARLRLNIESDFAKKRYELEKSNLEDLKAINEAYGKDTSEIDKKIADATIKENLRAAKKKEADDKAYIDAKKEITALELDDAQQGAQFLESVLNKKSAFYKAALVVDEAIAVARVIINTNQSIAAFAAANAGIPVFGEALIAEYTTAAYIGEGIQIAAIVAAAAKGLSDSGGGGGSSKFAQGGILPEGPSHAQGGINLVGPYGRVLGQVEGGEPILSRSTYANNRGVVNALLQSKGGPVDYEKVNQATTAREIRRSGVQPNRPEAGSGAKVTQTGQFNPNELISEVRKVGEIIDAKQWSINRRAWDKESEQVDRIRNNANS